LEIYSYSYKLPFSYKGKELAIEFSLDSTHDESELEDIEVREALYKLMARVNDMELTEDLITYDGVLDIWLPANQIRELLVHRIDYLFENGMLISYLEKVDVIETNEDDSDLTI